MFELRVVSAGGRRPPRRPLKIGTPYEAESAAQSLVEQGCVVELRNLRTGEVSRREPPAP
jgi:hypothetical protein